MSPAASRPILPAVLAIGGVALFVGVAVLVSLDLTDAFDGTIIGALRAAALHDLLAPLAVITELGSTWAVISMAVVTLAIGTAIGPWRHGVAGAVTIALASIGNSALKAVIGRERPELLEPLIVEHGYSFPSGHSALGMVAYGVLAVLISRSRLPRGARVAIVTGLAVLIGLIGLSRVWLGVHYPTDVLAGWAAGGVVVVAYSALTRCVSLEPAAAAVDADPAEQRSDRPGTG